jgi:hypothetical protein
MEKEFTQYTEALALKELGFDEPCFGWWFADEQMLIIEKSTKSTSENIIQAPLYQQAFRFFRESHGLIYSIGHIGHTNTWVYEIINMRIAGPDYGYGETYEEAELACLLELINICKKK